MNGRNGTIFGLGLVALFALAGCPDEVTGGGTGGSGNTGGTGGAGGGGNGGGKAGKAAAPGPASRPTSSICSSRSTTRAAWPTSKTSWHARSPTSCRAWSTRPASTRRACPRRRSRPDPPRRVRAASSAPSRRCSTSTSASSPRASAATAPTRARTRTPTARSARRARTRRTTTRRTCSSRLDQCGGQDVPTYENKGFLALGSRAEADAARRGPGRRRLGDGLVPSLRDMVHRRRADRLRLRVAARELVPLPRRSGALRDHLGRSTTSATPAGTDDVAPRSSAPTSCGPTRCSPIAHAHRRERLLDQGVRAVLLRRPAPHRRDRNSAACRARAQECATDPQRSVLQVVRPGAPASCPRIRRAEPRAARRCSPRRGRHQPALLGPEAPLRHRLPLPDRPLHAGPHADRHPEPGGRSRAEPALLGS